MLKTLLAAAAIVPLTLASAWAQEAEVPAPTVEHDYGVYAEVAGGPTSNGSFRLGGTKWNLDDGSQYEVAAGYDLGLFRLQGFLRQRSTGLSLGPVSADVDTTTLGVQAYVDAPFTLVGIQPYAGGGFGYTRAQASVGPLDATDEGWGPEWSVGARYALNPQVALGGKFTRSYPDLDFGGPVDDVSVDAAQATLTVSR